MWRTGNPRIHLTGVQHSVDTMENYSENNSPNRVLNLLQYSWSHVQLSLRKVWASCSGERQVQRQVDPVDDSLTPSVEWTPGWQFWKTWLSVPPHWLSLASWTGWRTQGMKCRNYSLRSQEWIHTENPWEKVVELMKTLWGFDNHKGLYSWSLFMDIKGKP